MHNFSTLIVYGLQSLILAAVQLVGLTLPLVSPSRLVVPMHMQKLQLNEPVKAITSGRSMSCLLTLSGAVKCWGAGGLLGDGEFATRYSPVGVIGLDSGVSSISAGYSHACALLLSGAIKCWGGNSRGQLGDGTTSQRNTPVDVVNLGGIATAIAAASAHTCALLNSGIVKCWGENSYGEVGDGTTRNFRILPTTVVGVANVDTIAAGGNISCALINGGAKCWGLMIDGERSTPADVAGLTTGVTRIATNGWSVICAALMSGGLKCLGYNTQGQLGDGTTTNRTTPVAVQNISGNVESLSTSSDHHTCAIVEGRAKCWGANLNGELGDGTFIPRLSPVDVIGLEGIVPIGISADGANTCLLAASGSVYCWGAYVIGNGVPNYRSYPSSVIGLNDLSSPVSANNHTCVTRTSGGLYCWGDNDLGQLGDGTQVNRSAAVRVIGLNETITSVATGGSHTCVVTQQSIVKCWGSNYQSQLGNEDSATMVYHSPVTVAGLLATQVAAGWTHTCALATNGKVYCWGSNHYGQLGDGTTITRTTPIEVTGITTAISLKAGSNHNCALLADQTLRCWGWNRDGQLGDGTQVNRTTPVAVSGLPHGVLQLSAGLAFGFSDNGGGEYRGGFTCALLTDHTVWCWGNNWDGQMGHTPSESQVIPRIVADLPTDVVEISAGGWHVCARRSNGIVMCWGSNSVGQLGNGQTTLAVPLPVAVKGLGGIPSRMVSGYGHTCALFTATQMRCWGFHANGQLGNGVPANYNTPQSVLDWPASNTVNVAGGTIASRVLTTTFPSAAFTATVIFTQTQLNPVALPEPPTHTLAIGSAFELTATVQDSGDPIQPIQPFTITVDIGDVSPALQPFLQLHYWDSDQWVREPSGQVDLTTQVIVATPNHFSEWAVFGFGQSVYLPLAVR